MGRKGTGYRFQGLQKSFALYQEAMESIIKPYLNIKVGAEVGM